MPSFSSWKLPGTRKPLGSHAPCLCLDEGLILEESQAVGACRVQETKGALALPLGPSVLSFQVQKLSGEARGMAWIPLQASRPAS